MKFWLYPTVAIFAVAALTGCGSKEAAPADGAAPKQDGDKRPASETELYEIWDQLSAQTPESVDIELARGVANNLAQFGPEKLLPLLDKTDSAEAEKTALFLAMVALRPLLKPEHHEAKLVELTQPEKPSRTRRAAIELLSTLGSESGIARVNDLMDDSDPRVAAGAMLALLHQENQPEAVSRVKEFWDNPETVDLERQEIVRRIPELSSLEHADIFIKAVSSMDWDPHVRQRAISILGAFTDTKAQDALKEAAANSPEPQLKDLATKAVEAMQERLDAGMGNLKFNVRPDGVLETQMQLESKPLVAPAPASAPAAEPAPAE